MSVSNFSHCNGKEMAELTKISPTIVDPAASGTSKGSKSTCSAANGEERQPRHSSAVRSAVMLPAIEVRNPSVCSLLSRARSGFIVARTAGTTLEFVVIWLRADAM